MMCLKCSGRHRALGVHRSFVQSLEMDSLTEQQLAMLRSGSNDALHDFLQVNNINKIKEEEEKEEEDEEEETK